MQQNQQFRNKEPFFVTSSSASTLPSSIFTPISNQQTFQLEREQMSQKGQEHCGERITGLHARLQQETEKIRRWKTQTEIELRKKDQKIIEGNQTIANLRKSALELQLTNENLSQKFQEEIANREEIVDKINSTRNMCSLLKDNAEKLDDRLQKCETEKTELKYMEMTHKKNFEELAGKFEELEITALQTHDKLKCELDAEKTEKLKISSSYQEQLTSAEQQLAALESESNVKDQHVTDISQALEANKRKFADLVVEYDAVLGNLKEKTETVSANKEQLCQTSNELNKFKEATLKLELQIDETTNRLQETIANKEKMSQNFDETEKLYVSKIKVLQDNLDAAKLDQEKQSLRIEELQCRLAESKSNIEDLKCAKDILLMERTETKQSMKSLENAKALLSKQLTDLETQLCQLTSDCANTKDEAISLNEVHNLTKLKLEEHTKELVGIKDMLKVKEEKILSLTEQLETKEESYNQLAGELEETRSREMALCEQLKTLKTELENESGEYQTVLEKNTQLNKDKKALQENLLAASKDLNKVNKELEKSKKKETATSKKLDASSKEFEAIKISLEEFKEEMKKQIEEKDKCMQQEKDNAELLLRELENTKKLLETSERKENGIESEIATKNKEIKDFKKEVEQLQQKLKRVEEEKQGIETHCENNLERMVTIMDKTAATADGVIDKQNKEIVKLTQQINSLQHQQKQLEHLQKELDLRDNDIKSLKDDKVEQVTKLENEVSDLNKENKRLEKELATRSAEMETVTVDKSLVSASPTTVQNTSKVTPSSPLITKTPQLTDSIVRRTPKQKLDNDGSIFRTPQSVGKGILRLSSTMSASKKRRVVFTSIDSEKHSEASSTSDMIEVELGDTDIHFKKKCGKSMFNLKPTPSNQSIPIVIEKHKTTPKLLTSRKEKSDGETELEKFRKLFPNQNVECGVKPEKKRTIVKKTPTRSAKKFFKSPRAGKKNTLKQTLKSDDLAWFDNDAVFGFGPED